MIERYSACGPGGTSPWLRVFDQDIFEMSKEEFLSGKPPIPYESVDLVITSPPYKKKDGFSLSLILTMATICRRVLKPGGWMFVNFGQIAEELDRANKVQRAVADNGLIAHQTIIWVKSLVIDGKQRGHYTPINSESILNYGHEYIFMFYKEASDESPGEWVKPKLDRLSIGVPFADKSNLTRGTRGSNGDVHCGGDVWFVPYATTGASKKKESDSTPHAYEYPEELVERMIKLSGVSPGSTVFDPFLGSGTTAVVAKKMGMNAVGCEIDRATAYQATARWETC